MGASLTLLRESTPNSCLTHIAGTCLPEFLFAGSPSSYLLQHTGTCRTDCFSAMRGADKIGLGKGKQPRGGSQIFCVKHRRLAIWWMLACTEYWIQLSVGDYRISIVLTRTLCSPSRLRKQDSQLSAFLFLMPLSLSSCSLTFLSTYFPSEICSESWQNQHCLLLLSPLILPQPIQILVIDKDIEWWPKSSVLGKVTSEIG